MRKRFLFVMGFSCPFPGAGWSRISYFAKHFREKGYDCRVLSSFSAMSMKDSKVTNVQGIPIFNVIPSIMVDNPLFLFVNNLMALIVALPFFICTRPHVIIISVPPANQLLSILFLSKVTKLKVVIDYRDEFEDYSIMHSPRLNIYFYKFFKRVLSTLYTKSHLVSPVSSTVNENLMRRGVLNSYTTFDGVDTTVFKPLDKQGARSSLKISNDLFVIIFLGYIYDAYRLDVVVKALSVLKERNPANEHRYLLVIVGGGEVEKLLNYTISLGIRNMVKYVGVISDVVDVVKVLNSADVGIIPYDDNPLWKRTHPTKLFEYTACGLPILGTVAKDSLLAKYVQENSIGITVPPLDSESLADAIEQMRDTLNDPSNISLNALNYAKKYDKSRIVTDLLSRIMEDK